MGKEVDHGYNGKGSLLHLVVDKEERPLWVTAISAKGNERVQALVLLGKLRQVSPKKISDITSCEADNA